MACEEVTRSALQARDYESGSEALGRSYWFVISNLWKAPVSAMGKTAIVRIMTIAQAQSEGYCAGDAIWELSAASGSWEAPKCLQASCAKE
jgi:hypothetical protein